MEASKSHLSNGHSRREANVSTRRSIDLESTSRDWPTELILLGAADRTSLLARIDQLTRALAEHHSLRLPDLGHTLLGQLPAVGVRLALIATTVEDLTKKLASAREQLGAADCDRIVDPSGIYFEQTPLLPTHKLALLFPGEGSQYLGMLADLVPHFPEVRDSLAEVDEVVGPDGDDPHSVTRFFTPLAELDETRRAHLEQRLRQIDWAMFSVLAANNAVGCMIEGIDLQPDAIAGHSAGELSALVGAGSLAVRSDLPQIVDALRAQGAEEKQAYEKQALAQPADRDSALLLATAASRETLEAIIADVVPEAVAPGAEQAVFVAMDNCPHQSVVVGLHEPMLRVEAALKERRIYCDRLPFSRPYHTPLFEPYMGHWRKTFENVSFRSPTRALYSCTTADLFPTEPDAVRDLAVSHWHSPVEFRRMIQRMYDSGVRLFVEAGPRGILSSFIQDILRGRPCLALAADMSRRSAITQWNHLVGQLAVHHARIDLSFLYRHRQVDELAWLTPTAASTTVSQPAVSVAAQAVSRVESPAPAAAAPPVILAAPAASRPAPPPILPPTTSTTLTHTPQHNMQPSEPSSILPRTPGTVVARHFQMMDRFVADQQSAMQAFLEVKTLQPPRRANVAPPTSRTHSAPAVASPQSTPVTIPAVGRPIIAPTAPAPPNPPPASAIPTDKYPLRGKVIRHEPGVEMVVQRRMDLSQDRYADDHTVGGRDVSRMHPQQRGLPVMPMTFILEMMSEAATQFVPDHVVLAVRDVQLQKWLAFDEEVPSTVEMVVKPTEPAPSGNVQVQVSVRDLGRGPEANRTGGGAVSMSTVELARQYPQRPLPAPMPMTGEQPCRVTIDTLYRNLFHGEMFVGVRSLDTFGQEGLKATIEVLPRHQLFASLPDPQFLIDPVTVDIGMHPTAAWHLEQPDQAGRMLLPFELKQIEFFGPMPQVGERMLIHTQVTQSSPRHFTHAGEFIQSDGKLWCRLTSVKCWRFYLPFGDTNFNGPKDQYFISQEWPHGLPGTTPAVQDATVCVCLDPTGDLSQVSMQEAAARVTLSDREMRAFRQLQLSVEDRTAWLFGRIAMKDAARLLWHRRSGVRHFIADLEISSDPYDRFFVALRDGKRPAGFPAISLARLGAKYIALAAFDDWCGLAIEPISADTATFDDFEPSEQALLKTFPSSAAEQQARGKAARAALRQALGPALILHPDLLHIRAVDPTTGLLELELDTTLSEVFPEWMGVRIPIRTELQEECIVAATAGPALGAQP
jgi:malonyl CoA-acyl carrier protein transacylase